MRILLFFLLLLPIASQAEECAVLLHGFAKNHSCMEPLEAALKEEGYTVLNISYPTTKYSIDTISKEYLPSHLGNISKCSKVHFIGHSMGGVLTRHYLSQNKIENLGHVVLITVPNKGSSIASEVSQNTLLSWIVGPAISDLAPDSPLLKSLPEPHYEIGVITANKSSNPFTSLVMLEGEDDGTLTADSMKISNMQHHVSLATNHTLVLNHPDLMKHVKSFLAHGKFNDCRCEECIATTNQSNHCHSEFTSAGHSEL